jgi:mannose-1-phosphate guanylyltransferase
MVVAPSDHLILEEKEFLNVVKEGLDFVQQEKALMTIGIPPSRPETGYGYIQVNGGSADKKKFKNLRKVKTFTEKPDLKLARVFLESGEFFWNSGIFFWSAATILDSFARYLPDMHARFEEGKGKYDTFEEEDFIAKTYAECKYISIDYRIMEKADNVYVITADIGWSDLGTWGSLHDQMEKDKTDNTIIGEHVVTYDLEGCLVSVPADKLVVLQGLKDFIVVETDDILLVCRMEDEQKIKNFVNDVRMLKGGDYV